MLWVTHRLTFRLLHKNTITPTHGQHDRADGAERWAPALVGMAQAHGSLDRCWGQGSEHNLLPWDTTGAQLQPCSVCRGPASTGARQGANGAWGLAAWDSCPRDPRKPLSPGGSCLPHAQPAPRQEWTALKSPCFLFTQVHLLKCRIPSLLPPSL